MQQAQAARAGVGVLLASSAAAGAADCSSIMMRSRRGVASVTLAAQARRRPAHARGLLLRRVGAAHHEQVQMQMQMQQVMDMAVRRGLHTLLLPASSSTSTSTSTSTTARAVGGAEPPHFARASFSSSPAAPEASGGGFATERDYHHAADAALDEVQALVEGLEDAVEDFEANLSQGVLNIVMGEHGTWVLNKQTPNRQVWWSSPISGPLRFEYDAADGTWRTTRDRRELFALLAAEVHQVCGVDVAAAGGKKG